MEEFISNSETETQNIASSIAKNFKSGDVVALIGDLGAGKTAFVRGAVNGLGGDATAVCSPTFALVNEYIARMPVYHFDVYRLQNVSANECDWLDDYLFGDGVCLIEWAENIIDILPNGYMRIEIEKISENERKIIVR